MKPLSDVKKQKQNLIKIFLLVALLSTGISLVANYITGDTKKGLILIIGLICISLVAFFYFIDYLGQSSNEMEIESAILIDKDKKPIPIDRFRFSEDFTNIVHSVLSENKAYESLWQNSFTRTDNHLFKDNGFVNEFLEYLYVNWISLQLNSYFSKHDKDATEIVGREQIPYVLIKNRVIELITKPYYEREKFQKTSKTKKPDDGEIVYLYGENKVVYNKLAIELPRKSKVFREGNALFIKNRNFIIGFESSFEGYTAVLPRYFERFYMNRSMDDTDSFLVRMKLSIKLKPFFLFSVRDWKYLGWLDQLESEFIKYFSFDSFIEKVGFEQATTEHILFLNGLRKDNNDEAREKSEDRNGKRKIKEIKIIKLDEDNDSK